VRNRGQRRIVLGATTFAIFGLVSLTARTVHAQIAFLSANGNTLVVSVNCSPLVVIPGPCGSVSWTSSAPGDSFSPPVSQTVGPSTTAATASTVLILGSTPGPRTVTATSAVAGSVTFTVNGGTSQAVTTQQAVGGTQQAVGGTQQAVSLGTSTLTTTTFQNTNIGVRLAALRRTPSLPAEKGLSGLPSNPGGQTGPLAGLAGLTGGGATADSSSILSRLGTFATAQGSFGNQDATTGESGFDFHTAGITLGVDYRFTEQFIFGLAFGYLRTKMNFDSSAGDSSINSYSLSAYTNYYILDPLYVDGIITFGWSDYSTERNIPGATATANGQTNGTQLGISTGTGYNFNAGPFTFGPTFRVNYVHVHIDSYQESGANPFNLHIGSQTIESVTTQLGGQATYAIGMTWGVLMPLLSANWQHEYKNNSRNTTGSVVAQPSTNVVVQTNNPDRDYGNVGVGVSATFRGGKSAFLHYEEVIGLSNFTNHSFNAGFRLEF
jgi:outer membrane lipase/esterase